MSVADLIASEHIACGVKKCLPRVAAVHELYDLLSRWQSGVMQRAAIFHA